MNVFGICQDAQTDHAWLCGERYANGHVFVFVRLARLCVE